MEDLSVFIKPGADEEKKTKENKNVSLDEFIIQENASEQNGSDDEKAEAEPAAKEMSEESLNSQENADNSSRSKGVGKLFDWLKGKK